MNPPACIRAMVLSDAVADWEAYGFVILSGYMPLH